MFVALFGPYLIPMAWLHTKRLESHKFRECQIF
jgi:hypothetical protein